MMTAGESTASPPSPEALHGDLESLWQQLQRIRERAEALEARFEPELQQVHPNFAASARNLLHYFALRQYDIGELQERLSELGLSSLGRAEHHVLASIHAVQHALLRLCSDDAADSDAGHLPFPPGEKRLQLHARALLGEPPAERAVPIMVTLPTAAADDYDYVRGLMSAGMDLARINCAHDTQEAWLGMIRNVRMASDKLGRPCRIMMDLGGPKFRTGQLQPGPKVSRLRPRRDALGQVLAPRRVRCVPDDEPWTGTKSAVVPVPRRSIELAEIGDLLRFKDTRGRRRKLEVVLKDNKGLVLELYKTAYIGTDLSFRLVSRTTGEELEFRFGELPPVEQPIMLHVGDPLILTRDGAPGAPAVLDKDDRVTTPARVSCRPVEIFEQVAINDPVSLDDGRIEGIVEEVSGIRRRACRRRGALLCTPARGRDRPAGRVAKVPGARRADRGQDRDQARIQRTAADTARGNAAVSGRLDDRPRRSGDRVRLGSPRRNPGRDAVDLRGSARAGDLGDAGARGSGQEGHAYARRDYRRGDVAARRLRDAEQGAEHTRRHSHARQDP
jgi:pyruvate kinase